MLIQSQRRAHIESHRLQRCLTFYGYFAVSFGRFIERVFLAALCTRSMPMNLVSRSSSLLPILSHRNTAVFVVVVVVVKGTHQLW